MTEPSGTVFVVDDDGSMRDALASLIRSVNLEVEVFASAQDFVARARSDVPSCLVLDVRMPGMSGLDLQQLLLEAAIPVPIVFITAHGDIPMSVKAVKAGAIEFLPKPFRDQDLLDAVRLGLERDRARRAREEEIAGLRRRWQTMTPREQEVMSWVVSGRLNKQIAAALGSSEVTVKVHRGHVMRKMGADSLADLVRMAGRLGLPERR